MKVLCYPEDWAKGAVGLSEEEITDGLLFVMHQTAPWPISMDGVLLPLDIYWLSESGMVVEHAELFPGLPTYWPDSASKYVLELPMHATPTYRVGDFVELPA